MEMIWMTMEETRPEIAEGTPVIVPFGSTEEHGPHLPLATDTLQAYGIAVRAAALEHALVAPPVHYGHCSSTRNHPGTVTLTAGTLRSLAKDLIQSLAHQGFFRIIFFSGHAGRIHISSLREAAEECVKLAPRLLLAVVSDYDLVMKGAKDLIQTAGDSHAGEVETSRMLYLHPDAVKGRAEEEYPSLPAYRVVPDPENYWPGGVWGDPSVADQSKGQALIEKSAEALAGIVRDLKLEKN